MMLFGWGNMRDPRNDTVAEAQDGRIRKGTNTGEPLDRDPRNDTVAEAQDGRIRKGTNTGEPLDRDPPRT